MGAHAPITALRPEANGSGGIYRFFPLLLFCSHRGACGRSCGWSRQATNRFKQPQQTESTARFPPVVVPRAPGVAVIDISPASRESGRVSQFSERNDWNEVRPPVRARGEAGIVAAALVTMPSSLAHAPLADVHVRKAERADLDALIELEHRVFATDRLSRRSLQRFLGSPTAEVMVAEQGARLAGNAIVLFRPRSLIARLYSLAVAPQMGGRGIAPMLPSTRLV